MVRGGQARQRPALGLWGRSLTGVTWGRLFREITRETDLSWSKERFLFLF